MQKALNFFSHLTMDPGAPAFRARYILAAIVVLAAASAHSANISLTASDTSGTSSFNAAGKWSSLAAPSAGNDYFTVAFNLRTPTANGSYTFAGDSLTIGGVGTSAAGAMQGKVAAGTLSANYHLNGGMLFCANNNGSVLTVAGTVAVDGASFLGAFASSTGPDREILDVTALISGSANLQINLAANTSFGGSSVTASTLVGTVRLSGANTYNGTITVVGAMGANASTVNGALQLNNLNAVQNATVTLNTTTFTAPALTFLAANNSGTYNIGALATGANSPGLALKDTAAAAVAISVGGNNASTSFGGAISDIGSLAKTGSGTFTLSGANTYTGNTTVSAGTLKLSAGSLGNTAISVTGTGTLAIQPGGATTINIGTTATAAAGATLNLGGQTFDMTDGAISTCNLQQESTFAGSALTIASGATLKFDAANSTCDLLAVTKGASVSGTISVTLNTSQATSWIGSPTFTVLSAASGLNGATWQLTSTAVTVGGVNYTLGIAATATAVTVTATPSISATISATPTTLSGSFSTTYGTTSSSQTVSVSGSGLTANITATAPTGLEVSSDGSTFGSTATFTQSAGNASGTLYVRMPSTAPVGSYNSVNVVLSSTGAQAVNVATTSSGNTVSPKTITVSGASALDKIFDGTATAVVQGTPSGFVNGDNLTLSGSFATANPGTGLAVTLTLTGTGAGNYTVTQPVPGLTAGILGTNITLQASDPTGTSSFNAAGQWNIAAAPVAGNTYFSGAFTLRTPTTGGPYTFGGDSLSIDSGGTFNGKVGKTFTVNNGGWIFNGGTVHSANSASDNIIVDLEGSHVNVTASTALGAVGKLSAAGSGNNYETLKIGAPISGDSSQTLTIGGAVNGGQDVGLVQLSAANPFNGTIAVPGSTYTGTGSTGLTGGYTSTTVGGLQLADADAVSNATLNLTATLPNPVSFAASIGAFNVGALSGSSSQQLADTNSTAVGLVVGKNNASTTYSGALSGAGSLTKIGNGTLTLTGANTYSGNTTNKAGAIFVNNTLASPSIEATGGILGGNGSISGTVTINSGATLWAGTGAGNLGTLTLGTSPILNGQVWAEIYKGNSPASDQIAVTSLPLTYGGTLVVSNSPSSPALAAGDSFTLFNASSYSGWFSGVTVPALSGLSWDTNNMATTGVLDVYTFTTAPLTVATLTNTPATISAAKLAAHASSSKAASPYPTGWTASVSTAAANGTASFSAGALTYTPNTGFTGNDSFTVTFRDGHGWQTMAVSVAVGTQNVGPQLTTQSTGGFASFTASGMPSTVYTVQLSTNLSDVPAFNDYLSVTTAPNGVINFTDDLSVQDHGGQVYYRLKQYVAP